MLTWKRKKNKKKSISRFLINFNKILKALEIVWDFFFFYVGKFYIETYENVY